MDRTTRTFIGIPLSPHARGILQNIQNDFKNLNADVKWVPPDNIHMTLKFLGEIQPQKLKSIQNIFPSLFQNFSRFDVAITRLGAFPNAQKPRVIWAGITQNAELLTEIAAQLENALGKLGFPKEDKKFSPHMTLGRVRSFKNIEKLSESIDAYQKFLPITEPIETIVLFKSTLASQGSIYEHLNEVKLN